MTLHPAAFRVGEYAKLESADTIARLQEAHAADEFLYCAPEMHRHAGKLVMVVQNSWPIPGVAYRLEEVLLKERQRASILGIWSEAAIADHCISTGINIEPSGQLASEIYNATADTEDGPGMVSIHDREGRLFCAFRDNDARYSAKSINHISTLRCRGAFEQYFGFDGRYSKS